MGYIITKMKNMNIKKEYTCQSRQDEADSGFCHNAHSTNYFDTNVTFGESTYYKHNFVCYVNTNNTWGLFQELCKPCIAY